MCLTSEVICSCRVLSELSGVAVRRCRSCQSCQAAAAVRRWAVAVRCCQVVLSGCCQALTHTSHTYDTIKRRPAGLYYSTHTLASTLPPVPPSFHGGRHYLLVCRTERIAERQGGVLLQVHLADDLVVAGPAEGLPIVVARQLVVLARSVLVRENYLTLARHFRCKRNC